MQHLFLILSICCLNSAFAGSIESLPSQNGFKIVLEGNDLGSKEIFDLLSAKYSPLTTERDSQGFVLTVTGKNLFSKASVIDATSGKIHYIVEFELTPQWALKAKSYNETTDDYISYFYTFSGPVADELSDLIEASSYPSIACTRNQVKSTCTVMYDQNINIGNIMSLLRADFIPTSYSSGL